MLAWKEGTAVLNLMNTYRLLVINPRVRDPTCSSADMPGANTADTPASLGIKTGIAHKIRPNALQAYLIKKSSNIL